MRCGLIVAVAIAGLAAMEPVARAQSAGAKEFATRCAGCHGADGAGGERGPSIVDGRRARTQSAEALRATIRKGVPEAGMPGFTLPDAAMNALVAHVESLRSPAIRAAVSGNAAEGERYLRGEGRCLHCHMLQGSGSAIAPDLSNIGNERRLAQMEKALRDPDGLHGRGYRAATVRLAKGGEPLRGLIKNESDYDLQLQTLDGQIHGLLRSEIAEVVRDRKSLMPKVPVEAIPNLLAFLSRLDGAKKAVLPAPPPAPAVFAKGDWPTYNGNWNGNRHSPLDQINTGNVGRLAPRWIFPVGNARRLEGTPVVVDGVMYVTTANECYALDARTGRLVWSYSRPLTKGLIGDASGAINRGVAVWRDRVFMVTDHAHLIALNRFGGQLLWETEMADYRAHYGATSAPLVVNDLVISGTSGGDEGARGFIAAYKAGTGERVWQFWTMPAKKGDPQSETWVGRAMEHGCATAWLTGSYDASTNLLYWATGNPCPDYNGDERKGDNLYSDSVLALEPETGRLRWYFQFTPHDLHDWDATEPLLAVDAEFRGRPRKLLMQANRNGFFYVLDRETGEFLLGEPFVKKLNWASGIGPDGRPKVLPNTSPTEAGNLVCPTVEGASNWMSTAYNPATRLFYVMALESCAIYTKSSAWWEPGHSFYGGDVRRAPDVVPEKYLRAIDPSTGRVQWERFQEGMAVGWGGVLSTAGGLLFVCDDSGALAAFDAATGRPLWHFHTNQNWKSSPMTYMVEGKQYVGVTIGGMVMAFGLVE